MKPTLWWLSFCDPDRPSGHQFLGAALLEATRLGINPGGEVVGAPIQPEYEPLVPQETMHRLLNRNEAQALSKRN